ncbi:hypothetical protein NN6n1_35390 [Shinella zoogloeoides]
MPVLNFTKEEVGTSLDALSVALSEWRDAKLRVEGRENDLFLSGVIEQAETLESRLQAVYDTITWATDPVDTVCETHVTEAEAKRRTAVAKMIIAEIDAVERAASGKAPTENTPAPRAGSAWHHEHGWLPSVLNQLEELKAFDGVRKEGITARRRISEQLAAFHEATELKPGKWTTLPEGFDVDADPFEITDPEEPLNAELFSRFTAREYDRIEIGVNGDRRSRYTVRKEDLENFLRDIHERFSERY